MFDVEIDLVYICKECNFKGKGFTNTETSCEDCGSHPAAKCPDCGEVIDLIYHEMEPEYA